MPSRQTFHPFRYSPPDPTLICSSFIQCPTTVVPFFGDQPFWGDAVFNQGVGPKAIPVGDFSLDRLVKALEFMGQPEVGLSCLPASSCRPLICCNADCLLKAIECMLQPGVGLHITPPSVWAQIKRRHLSASRTA